jgi:hypothetical protein
LETQQKILLFSIAFLTLVSVAFAPTSSFADSNEVLWDENRPLTWDDFQGPTDYESAAYIAWDFITDYTVQINTYPNICFYSFTDLNFTAVMIKDESFVWDDSKFDWLLNHEQTHFDLVQVFAKKIQNQLATDMGRCPDGANPTAQIRADTDIYIEEILSDSDTFSLIYDWRTNHGLKNTAQSNWDQRIDKLVAINVFGQESILSNMVGFTNDPVRLNFTGQTGKTGIYETDNNYGTRTISNVCHADDIAIVIVQLAGTGNCIIDHGNDLIIWSNYNKWFGVY